MNRLVEGAPRSMSVMIPALNAASVIDRCLDAVLAQELDLAFDVVVSVGPSDDDTAARVDARAARDARVRRIDNPSGATPSALNLAIQASEGDLVVRVDAHAELPPGYLARLADTATQTGAANVGGHGQALVRGAARYHAQGFRERLREVKRVLQLEIASHKTPERVDMVARTLLGMSEPSPDRIMKAGILPPEEKEPEVGPDEAPE